MPFINFIPRLIAHRGANNAAPENTLAAFLKAKELGATWLEFDVMLTACGEAVVFHDETLERTSNGFGRVIDKPYSYLKTLDAGSWFSPQFAGEKIPTFKETILFLKKHQLAANVEIKSCLGYEKKTVEKILNDIRENWADEMTPPLISSFSLPALQYVRDHSETANLGLLIDEWFLGWEEVCERLRCVSVNLNQRIVSAEKMKLIQEMGREVLCYTVNDPERARELFAMGVDAVFTDNFREMLLALRQ